MEELIFDLGISKPIHRKPVKYIITDSGCWNCVSHKSNSRRPCIQIKGKNINLARFVYIKIVRQINSLPSNIFVRHKCDNPECINPDHLEEGSSAQNSSDMVVRGRSAKGIKNGRSKLNEEKVIEIRRDNTSTITQIARRYNVDVKCIKQVKENITWKHVL